MQLQKCPRAADPVGRSLIAALVAIAAAQAFADEPTPYYVGASEAIQHDSNVYRLPDGPGDYYSSTGLLAGLDQPIGRQRIRASANLLYNKYRDQTTLDNTSYGLDTDFDWATIGQLSGSLELRANQSLATLNGNANQPTTERNLIKTEEGNAKVRWGGEGILSAEADYDYVQVRYSAIESLASETDTNTGRFTLFYKVGPTVTAGTGVSFTRTLSPYGVALVADPAGPGDYEGNVGTGRSLDLTVEWKYSPQSNLNARLSYTHQSNSVAEIGDFSGLTGAVAANYALTGKTKLTASFSRDAGANATYTNAALAPSATPGVITPLLGLTGTSQVSNSTYLGAIYAATAKINVNAGINLRRAKIVNSADLGGVALTGEQTDILHTYMLGADYAIARDWTLGCNVGHEARTLTGPGGFMYRDNVVGCMAQFKLR